MKKAVSVILINKEKQFLFHLRDNKKNIPFPNFWSFISGGVEENETLEEALKREVKEEIGCNIKNPIFVGILNIDNFGTLTYIYKAKINKKINEMNLTEGQKIKFFSYNDGINLKLPEILRDFLIKNKDKILAEFKE